VTVADRPAASSRPPAATGGRPRPAAADGTLARASAAAARLAEAVRAEEEAPPARSLRSELSRLVDRTNQPEFWDDAEAARATMSRIYQLQRVLDDVETLRERAGGLAEMAQRMRSARDRQRLPELRSALADVEARLDLLRLEVAGAATGGGSSSARLRATPLGPDAGPWARELVEMYATWATRTCRDVEVVPRAEGLAVVIAGPASAELLAPEAGLHRRVGRDGRAVTARVAVSRAGGEGDGRHASGAGGAVVRLYDEARRHVRDPRTGVQVRNPEVVLREGRVDAFLLGAMRRTDDAAAAPRL